MSTDKYIRHSGQWIRIQRNRHTKQFILAHGLEGQATAFKTLCYSFKGTKAYNWERMIEIAEQHIQDFNN